MKLTEMQYSPCGFLAALSLAFSYRSFFSEINIRMNNTFDVLALVSHQVKCNVTMFTAEVGILIGKILRLKICNTDSLSFVVTVQSVCIVNGELQCVSGVLSRYFWL